jgi:putative hydrolase of the HAD superfamily
MAPQFDAVSLDVGGVLVVPDHDTLAAALEAVGVSHDRSRFGIGHYLAMAAIDRASSHPEDFTDYLWAFVAAVGVARPDEARAHAALDAVLKPPVWCQPVTGSRLGLRALFAAGVRLAVTSNSDGTVADQLREHEWVQIGAGPGVPVEVITDSGVVGVGKPDRRMFEATVAGLHLPPSRVVHVGDSVHYDIEGAAAVGLHAVHMDPFSLCPSTAHPHIQELVQVLDLG